SVALAAMGVSGRTLRVCCQQYLGVSPHRYFRLRRLNLARHALLNAAPDSTVREISSRYAFNEPGRFAVLYRLLFGESPSATLRRRPGAEIV
ncbi:MAG: AraC family transcriptional regulator, partial [Acetobacteraceae bacterium]|nr:AraC family transcriptional regulator [Acetobacteraceae bacterium]